MTIPIGFRAFDPATSDEEILDNERRFRAIVEEGFAAAEASLRNLGNAIENVGEVATLVYQVSGSGDLYGDANAQDYTGQTGATDAAATNVNSGIIYYVYDGITYLWAGPRPTTIGVGGDYTAVPDDLVAFGSTVNWDDIVGKPATFPPSAHTHVEADITDLDRVRWRGNWVQQEYLKNDMVLGDGNWLTIANKTTTDVAPPRPVGNPQYDMPDAPAWVTNQFNGVVKSGREWTINRPVEFRGLQVWIPTVTADTNYVLFAYTYPEGQPDQITAIQVSEPLLNPGQWTTVTLNRKIATSGTVFGFFIDALNSGSSTLVTGGWGRAANTNDGTANPGTGNWSTNNAQTRVGISYTDLDTTDRTSELQGVIAGSAIELVQTDNTSKSITFTVNAVGTDQTTHINFADVTLADTGPNGAPDVGAVCTVNIVIPVPSPTDYVQIVGGNPTVPWGTARGLLQLGGVAQAVDADAFGVRALVDEYVVSPDWDIASSLGSGGSGGGGGGASTFTELSDTPASYAGQAGLVPTVKQDETGLEFLGGGGSSVTISDTPPADPGEGDLWWPPSEDVGLFIWYEDSDSGQWVQANGGGGSELQEFHNTGEFEPSWRIIGTTLEIWGRIGPGVAGTPVVLTHPKTFVRRPIVTTSMEWQSRITSVISAQSSTTQTTFSRELTTNPTVEEFGVVTYHIIGEWDGA